MSITTQEDIQTDFEALIETDSYWSKFVGSQFVTMLVTFISQWVYRCQQYADTALAEFFITTANKRASILAAANDRGYVATKPTPSTGKATLTNITAKKVTIPQYSTFISDDQNVYMTTEICKLAAGGTADVAVSQLELYEVSTTVTAATAFMEVLLSSDLTSVCHQLDVVVTTNGTATTWTLSNLFRLATSTSKVYTEFYLPTEQLGVRFGDGTIGKIPPAGSTITLKVWCTAGAVTLVTDQDLTPVDDSSSLSDYITAKTNGPISGGTGAESTEMTRNRAQVFQSYDNQVVWAGDYSFYVRGKIPGMSWIKVWGEQQQEALDGVKNVSNINNIFFSGWHPDYTQDELKALVLDALDDVPNELNKVFNWKAVNPLPFTITVTGTISASLVDDTVEDEIRTALETRFGLDSEYFDPNQTGDYVLIRHKDVWSYINSLGYFEDFELVMNDFQTSNGLFDFVYMDVTNSVITPSYDED